MKNNLKKIISILSLLAIIFIPFQSIASTIPTTPALFESSLSFPEATTDTSFTLVSNALQTGVLPSGYTCFTIDQGQPNTEFECGTVSGTSVTGVTRGIDPITGNSSDSALIFSHRRGADVKITDFPTLTVLSRILSQQDTLPQPISYATGVNPVGNQDLATKAYVNSVVTGGTVTTNQVTVAGTAGATIVTGNLVYLNVADGKWYPTTASTSTTLYNVQLGIAQGAGSVSGPITNGVLIDGVDTHTNGTAGVLAYASNTSGAISQTAGTNPLVIGQFVVSSGGVYFNPAFYYQITPNQEAALAGNGGTPSATNTYVTQQGIQTAATNPLVVVETASTTWVKPANLKYAVVEVIGAGGNGAGGASSTSGAGGGAGGYSKLTIAAGSLLSSETVTIGTTAGATSSFGSHNSATGGGNASSITPGTGGVGSGGDINLNGGDGFPGLTITGGNVFGSSGGASFYGNSVKGGVANGNGNNARIYGGGGGGGGSNAGGTSGGSYAIGVIIITEYFQ